MRKPAIDAEIKERRSELRSAGHYWGSKAADTVIEEGRALSADAIERRLEQIIAERTEALIELGADDDDIAAWGEACAKRFVECLCSHVDRQGGA